MEVTIDCRDTGHGALTYCAVWEGAEVRQHSASKSGNHWRETVSLKPDGWVKVIDISNSGKHNCYILRGDGTREQLCEPDECPRC
jgi:hypothetical protein